MDDADQRWVMGGGGRWVLHIIACHIAKLLMYMQFNGKEMVRRYLLPILKTPASHTHITRSPRSAPNVHPFQDWFENTALSSIRLLQHWQLGWCRNDRHIVFIHQFNSPCNAAGIISTGCCYPDLDSSWSETWDGFNAWATAWCASTQWLNDGGSIHVGRWEFKAFVGFFYLIS